MVGCLVAEARVQVKEATERLGGEYSGSLHPKCTHLVVQISFARHDHRVLLKLFSVHYGTSICFPNSDRMLWLLNLQHSFAGRKFEHALKHGPRNGLFLVTLGWFVDCVRRNSKLKLHESTCDLQFWLKLLMTRHCIL